MKTLMIMAAGLSLAATFQAHADMATVEGDHLVNAAGMTLYIFDKDKEGMSACYDACATNWPPLVADSGASAEGDFTLTERQDGSMQWAYKGMPLYLWIKDAKPGDMTGDGVNDVWHIARP